MSPALLLLAATVAAPPPVTELKLPPGFSARLYAGDALASDVYTMTIDDAGRVLVAGRGYVRVLIDDDNDGYADRAADLIDGLKDGPMGLLAEGDSLFVVSDGGLKRYRGYNGKDKLKGPPELLLALKTTGEHDAHAVRRGPDGWLYLLCGNMAGVRKEIITGDRSPVKEPVAGTLVRLSPDFKQVEVIADGFRNPYSFDFNLAGEPFTYDSENERCVGLPWYEGSRFYHIVPGGNYGWRSPQLSQTWRKPPYFPDVVPPICDTGRGSPTGVACYLHTAFPERYRDGFFLADWTFGRIFHVPLQPHNASYHGKHTVFAESTGTSGFAPTALAVHPKSGELFVSIGGRGTRGGVYRISYDKADATAKPLPMKKRSLDFDAEQAKQWLADCASDDASKRRVALEMLHRWWDKSDWGKKLAEGVKPNLSHEDRLVRRAAGRIGGAWYADLGPVTSSQARLTLALEQAKKEPKWALSVATETLNSARATDVELIAALRVIHLAYGDLTAKDAVGTAFEGYTFRESIPAADVPKLVNALVKVWDRTFGQEDKREVNLEVIRALAAIGEVTDIAAGRATLGHINEKTAPADDFHCFIALARMTRAPVDNGRTVVKAFFDLIAKTKQQNVLTDRHWPLRLEEVAARLAKNAGNFKEALGEHELFGRPEHVSLVQACNLPAKAAAAKFLAAAKKDKNYAWTPAVVELLAALPREEIASTVDRLWEQPHLADAIVRVLSGEPREGDQPKFVAGLGSLDGDVVYHSANALAKLKKPADSTAYVAAIKAQRRFPDETRNTSVRAAVFGLLQKHSGEKLGADANAWAAWLAKHDPAAAKQLNATDGFDAAAWQKRIASIEWAKGNAERGRVAFTKATCAACHDGGRAIGPSLLGVGKRFGRDDLLTAILQPNKDVSARYRPTRVVTTDDKTHTGVIIYEATDGVILQTGIDSTVRIAGAEIASKVLVDVSLMPAGLLDKLTDSEIADLLAYLNTLAEPKPK